MFDYKIAPQVLVSLATGPLLLGVLGGKVLAEFIQEIGQASEEIFRGDRLPMLNLPVPATSNETHPDESI